MSPFSGARPLLFGLGLATLAGCVTPPISANVSAVLAGPGSESAQGASSGPSTSLGGLRGRASSFPDGPRLDDLAVAALAVHNSPALKAARAQAGVADAQVFAVGLAPDPQLQLSFDHPTNFVGFDAMGATVGLDFLTSMFTRHGQLSRARAEALRVRDEIAWTEWTTAVQARDATLRVIYLRQQVAVAQSAVDQTTRQLRAFEAAVNAGDARLDDLAIRRVGFLDAEDRLRVLERDLAIALSELRGHIGVAPDEDIPLVDTLIPREPGALDAAALFERAVARRRDLAALRAGYDANEASLRHARLAGLPLPNLSLSRARDTSNVQTTGGGLSLVLPIWNRGRGDIAVARATRAQLQAEYAARIFQTRSDIAAQVDALERIAARRVQLDAEIDALSHEAEILGAASERGDVSSVVYETTRASLLDKRLASIALTAAQGQGEAALEGLVGGLIWRGAELR